MQRLSASKILPVLGLTAFLTAGGADAAGTLRVNIEPNNTAGARVLIAGPAGPNSKVRAVTADQSLSLPAGRYSIVVVGVRQAAPIVDNVFGVGSRALANIVNGQAVAVRADYAKLRPGSGRLWVPVRQDGQVQGFTRNQLRAGTDSPGLAITGAGSEPINAIFDGRGNMWVASFADSTLLKYNAATLATGGAPTPAVTISSNPTGSLNGPVGMAFDNKGNLWVGNFGSPNGGGAGDNTLVRFTPAQIARSGEPTPAVILTGFDNPYGHTFDAQGNLWVANNRAGNVLRFPPAQQVSGGQPDVTITETSTGELKGVRSPIFDQAGNLWVSSAGTNRVAGYTVQGTTVTPLVTVGLFNEQGEPVPSPDGIAFDNGGNLWVAGSLDQRIYRYAKADLDANGAIQAISSISGFGETRGVLISFNPKARPAPASP